MPPDFGVPHFGDIAILVLSPWTLILLVSTVIRGVVFVQAIDSVEHTVALIASLLFAGILEPVWPGVVLCFGLVHYVPPIQVSDMISC